MGSSPTARASLETVTSPSASQSSAALHNLTDFVKVDLAAVNAVLLQEMQSEIDLIPQLAHHLIASGGKRVRPLLTLVAAKLCGYQGMQHVDLAACVEFIHTATLLHDDVVD
ncbi:MAG TPA: farnesyltranstransferase, partial [Holosporales bacterium]|nr:farnesyltranstransferase [Holosporales bacterium]